MPDYMQSIRQTMLAASKAGKYIESFERLSEPCLPTRQNAEKPRDRALPAPSPLSVGRRRGVAYGRRLEKGLGCLVTCQGTHMLGAGESRPGPNPGVSSHAPVLRRGMRL